MKQLLTHLFLCSVVYSAVTQTGNIPIGEWRSHVAYYKLNSVTEAGDKVYAGGENSFFYYDKQENTVNTLSTVDGFAEADVATLKYDNNTALLVIGYDNGNLDIYDDRQQVIYNLDDIKRSAFAGSKKINHIHFSQNLAYLSCDFGVVVVDLQQMEVEDNFINIGPGGSQVSVYGSTLDADNDSIFLATDQGIMVGRISPGINLSDFNNWYTYGPSDSVTTTNIVGVGLLAGEVYAVASMDSIYRFNGAYWDDSPALLNNATVKSVSVGTNSLFLSLDSTVLQLTSFSTSTTLSDPNWKDPQDALIDTDGFVWIADGSSGLLTNEMGSYLPVVPNGPASNRQFSLDYLDDAIAVSHGAYNTIGNASGVTDGFSVFKNNNWKGHNWSLDASYPGFEDIVAAAYENSTGKLYLGSMRDGILILNKDGSYDSITTTTPGTPFVTSEKVSDLLFDENGNLWVANFGVASGNPSLHKKDKNDNWTSYDLTIGVAANERPVEIVIDDFGTKWIRVLPSAGGGIIVFNEQSGNIRHLTATSGQGGLPDKDVHAIAKGKDEEIWVGTDFGVAVFFNPSGIFSGSVNASTPIFNSRRLLEDEKITSIEVDGGNRKWVGSNKGLWLFEDGGTEQVLFLSKMKTPVFSDNIIDIEINEVTGEVFFATSKGLISYRYDATEGGEVHGDVKIFPNPVRPEFDGIVGISGLAADAQVKITDVVGNLVYDTDAHGGTATWNARGHDGKRVASGVYLVFSSSPDGEDAFVGKIAVIE